MLFRRLCLTLLVLNTVCSQKHSPCPDVLIYEPRDAENNRWYAVVNLSTRESLKGLWLTITLDHPAEQLGNIFGDAATSNYRDFLIRSNNYILEAGTITPVRFFVKYNPSIEAPNVKEINLNGRIICSGFDDQTNRHLPKPTSSSTNRRPTNSIGIQSSSTHRHTSPSTLNVESTNSNRRPASSNQEGGRTSKPSISNSRPSTGANRPSDAAKRPASIDDLEISRPNRPNTNTRLPNVYDDLEIEAPSQTALPHGSSPKSRPSTHTDDLEISGPNRPVSTNTRLSSDEIEVPSRSSINSNPTSYIDDLEVARPSRPTLGSSNRPYNINGDTQKTIFRPQSSNNHNNEAPNFYENGHTTNNNRPTHETNNDNHRPTYVTTRYNENANRPTYSNNRDPDGYGGGSSYNKGSSSLSAPEDNDDFFAGDFSAIVSRPPSNPSTRPSVHRNQKCGVVAAQPRPLISFGQDTEPGQWPWHVALYHSKGIQLMYTCGGTLISKSHIVTAAHCVTKPRTNRPINPQNILAYLGKSNLRKFGSEIQDREVGDIYLHPEYNYSGYFNDIAILRLVEPIEITNYVRPVCLWDERTDLNEVEGKLGTVVGWGFNENGVLTTTLMQAQMPIVSLATCIYSNRDFFSQFTSEKSFCGGFRNGTSVCNGDSGGSMVFPKQGTSGSNTVWQIRGLVSVGVAFQGKIICDTSQYVVFTDVAKHLDWIQSILINYS